MSDQLTPVPVKTKTAGDVAAKIVDTAGTNQLAIDPSGRVTVNVNGTVTIDSELPTAAALADNTGNPTVPAVGAFLMLFDGTNWDRAQTGAGTGGAMKVDGSAVTQPVSIAAQIDTELPTAAALSDTTANPTAPMVGAAGMIWDGSQWRRAAADSNGNLKVTSAGLVSPKLDTLTSSALAAGANVTVDGTQVASGKTGKLLHVVVSASVPMKAEIITTLNGTGTVRAVLFTSAAHPTESYTPNTKDFITQAQSATAGYDGFSVKFTNLDNANAGDVYATLEWDEV